MVITYARMLVGAAQVFSDGLMEALVAKLHRACPRLRYFLSTKMVTNSSAFERSLRIFRYATLYRPSFSTMHD